MFNFKPRKFTVEGVDFFIRMLDWDESEKFDKQLAKCKVNVDDKVPDSDIRNDKKIQTLVVSMLSQVLTDAEGNRLFKDNDPQINKIPVHVCGILFHLARRVNTVTKEDIEAVQKN